MPSFASIPAQFSSHIAAGLEDPAPAGLLMPELGHFIPLFVAPDLWPLAPTGLQMSELGRLPDSFAGPLVQAAF